MRCPFCSQIEDKVVDTRPSDNENVIRRRRECAGCGRRFTTYERIDEVLPLVVKKDGRREPFDRAKIVGGLARACEKRPVSVDTIEAVTDQIERAVQEGGDKEVPSSRIGEAVMDALHELDAVAYVRFASVYRSFRDVHEFMRELEDLIAERGAGAAGREKRSGRKSRGR
jgi:transcriptional repressor NrdR